MDLIGLLVDLHRADSKHGGGMLVCDAIGWAFFWWAEGTLPSMSGQFQDIPVPCDIKAIPLAGSSHPHQWSCLLPKERRCPVMASLAWATLSLGHGLFGFPLHRAAVIRLQVLCRVLPFEELGPK